jgi:hypothetical protein
MEEEPVAPNYDARWQVAILTLPILILFYFVYSLNNKG